MKWRAVCRAPEKNRVWKKLDLSDSVQCCSVVVKETRIWETKPWVAAKYMTPAINMDRDIPNAWSKYKMKLPH